MNGCKWESESVFQEARGSYMCIIIDLKLKSNAKQIIAKSLELAMPYSDRLYLLLYCILPPCFIYT